MKTLDARNTHMSNLIPNEKKLKVYKIKKYEVFYSELPLINPHMI